MIGQTTSNCDWLIPSKLVSIDTSTAYKDTRQPIQGNNEAVAIAHTTLKWDTGTQMSCECVNIHHMRESIAQRLCNLY